jgi:hypothetical protein
MTGDQINAAAEEIRQLLAERLGARGRTFDAAARRAGRRLPRRLRAEARFIAQAQDLALNPRLLRMVDPAAFARAQNALRDHLLAIDPRERRRTALLNWIAALGFYVLVTAGLVIAVLAWQGLV